MSIRTGDKAQSFTLAHKPGETVDLSADLGTRPIVLLFFPFAFSSVCTDGMCHFRDNWSQWEQLDAAVYGICVDSPFVTDKFRQEMNIPFPILSDFNKEVARAWGAIHEDLKGMKGVAKRSAFVIGPDGTVVYDWVSDNPGTQVDFDAVRTAVEGIRAGA